MLIGFLLWSIVLTFKFKDQFEGGQKLKSYFSNFIHSSLKEFRYNLWLWISIQYFLPISFLVMIGLKAISFKSLAQSISSILTLVYLSLLIIFFLLIPVYLFKKWNTVSETWFIGFETFFSELKPNNQMSSILTLNFYFFFFVWRFIFSLVLSVIWEHMMTGCYILLVLSICQMLYYTACKPFKSTLQNILAVIQESVVLIYCFSFMFYIKGLV